MPEDEKTHSSIKLFHMIKELEQKLEALENHDIFRIWSSLRTGGKTTLDAILKDNARIKQLEKQISELGDKLQKCGVKWDFSLAELNGSIEYLKDYNAHRHLKFEERFTRIQQVLRDFFNDMSIHYESECDKEWSWWKSYFEQMKEKLDAKPKRKVKNADSYRDKILTIKEPTEAPIIKVMAGFQWIHNGKMYITVEKVDLETIFNNLFYYTNITIPKNQDLKTEDLQRFSKLRERYLKEKEDADES